MRRQSILPLLIPLFFLFLNVKFAISGQISTGQPCDLSKNVLDRATHKFSSDCNPRAYCSQNATCTSKGCRRDEYPFGYVQGEAIPPMCAVDQYCPDEEDACRPLIALGAACQLNRDGRCFRNICYLTRLIFINFFCHTTQTSASPLRIPLKLVLSASSPNASQFRSSHVHASIISRSNTFCFQDMRT